MEHSVDINVKSCFLPASGGEVHVPALPLLPHPQHLHPQVEHLQRPNKPHKKHIFVWGFWLLVKRAESRISINKNAVLLQLKFFLFFKRQS